MGRMIGLDWGTTNTSAAFDDGKGPQIIEMPDGARLMPSVIAFDDDNNPLVGNPAINAGKIAPLKCFRFVKRVIGQLYVQGENHGPQTLNKDGKVWFRVPDGGEYPPQKFAAVQISAILDAAEAKYGDRPDGVAIGVPAGYREHQRNAIFEAVQLAGISPDRIFLVEEPKAAALAYGAGRKKYALIAVYDWGGGTFDFSLVKVGGGRIEVIGTRGNSRLGGKDVDDLVLRDVLLKWKEREGVDLSLRDATTSRIRDASEEAKIDLTANPKSAVRVDFVDSAGPENVKHMNEPMTREELEAMARDTVLATFGPIEQVLAETGTDKSKVDEVILVGGQTRMPLVRQMVQDFFGKKPQMRIPPEEAVALGCAKWAAIHEGRGGDDEFNFVDRATHSLHVETLKNVPHLVIRKGTKLPAERKVTLTTSVDDQPVVGVHILEGDDDRADGNTLLARYYPEAAPAPAGTPSAEITIRREADGSVRVTHDDVVIFERRVA